MIRKAVAFVLPLRRLRLVKCSLRLRLRLSLRGASRIGMSDGN